MNFFNLTSTLDRMAGRFALPHLIFRIFDLPQLIKWSKIPRGAKILELGCGTGRNARYISHVLKSKQYVAVDRDPGIIAEAEAQLNTNTRIIFQVADVCRLPFNDNCFDAVIEIELLHHIPNWKKAVREIHRVLKKGGKLVLKDYSIETFTVPAVGLLFQQIFRHPYDFMFDQIEFLTYLKKNGFEITHQNDNSISLALVAVCKK